MKNYSLKTLAFRTLTTTARLHARKKRLVSNEVITVLNLHRVAPNTGSTYNALAPALFNELIVYLKKEFYICLFSELEQIQSHRPKLILSFDDGYKDFIDYAVPVLDKHKVRVNQNIIPYSVETGLPPVNVLLQDFIGKAPIELLKKIPLEIATDGDRHEVGRAASFAIKYLPAAQFVLQREVLLDFLLNYPEFLCASAMTKQDILDIAAVHEIGAHSYEHLSMESQQEDYFLEDLQKCKTYFAEDLSLECNIYAFPNGSATKKQVQQAKEQGFDHILLVGDKYSPSRSEVFNRFTFDVSSMDEAKYKSFGRRALIT
ncbi:polysaccharide deacetylase family protein [Psychrobacter sp. Ps3]|uniref:polysaccharide deacetylase family protein n=1 Tax=Psychrobacter sp. Ps3 TaxID=2790957 RepID=UPI001EE0C65B|nr:polysaccharide deacetylase family protein [Psychrobacter sp. Ps3]MCG3881915.1 polysaccharide deacetylase family protein [Psychrobacter sp. Ps3]